VRALHVGAVALAAALLIVPSAAWAIAKTCTGNAVNDANQILCGGTTTGACVFNVATEITAGGCTFDLQNRTLSVNKRMQMIGGAGFIDVINAGDIGITATGRLESRGDFNQPSGTLLNGGRVSLTSNGVITMVDRAQIDVSGDGGGTISMIAHGANASAVAIDLQDGSVVAAQGFGISDEGDRFSDGGSLELTADKSTTPFASILENATVKISGANQALGGAASFRASRDITIGGALQLDATGGGGDGGDIDVLAGDNIVVNQDINVDSRAGGGFGGTMAFAAGEDFVGGIVKGGAFTLNTAHAQLLLSGSEAETFAGDGGDLEITSHGLLQFTAGGNFAIQANAGATFDGFGGTIFLDSSDNNAARIDPDLDGDVVLNAKIVATSGSTGGDGGEYDATAGKSYTQNSLVDLSGKDTGGDFTVEAGSTVTLNGLVDAHATLDNGDPGFVDVTAGQARGDAENGLLNVKQDILAIGGASSGGGQSISLAGCTLLVDPSVQINGSAGTSALNVKGGSDIELIGKRRITLKANSKYLATPGGTITATHQPLPGSLIVESGVVVDPPLIDNATTSGFFPNCPVCGNGTREAGEVCDPGAGADGACCNSTCTAFLCATPTVTATPQATGSAVPTSTPGGVATATRTPTPTATATRTATPVVTTTRTATPTATTTPPATATRTATPTATATSVATATRTATPTATTTPPATATRTATPTATATSQATATRTATPTATSTPQVTASATRTATPTVTATAAVTATATRTATPTVTTTATPPPGATATLTATPAATATATRTASPTATATATPPPGATATLTATPAATATATRTASPTPTATGTPQSTATSTATPAPTGTATATASVTPTATATATRTATPTGTTTPSATVSSTATPSGTATVTTTPSTTPSRTPTPSATATVAGSATPTATPSGRPNIPDLQEAAAAAKCQDAIKKGGWTFVAKKLKSLDKCANGIFKCLQTAVDTSAQDACVTKAAGKCPAAFAKIAAAEGKLRALIAKACSAATVPFDDILAAEGLGFDALAETCATSGTPLNDISDVADCVVRQHECRVEQIFEVQEPRAAELLRRAHVSLGPDACLVDHGDGGVAGDPRTIGKALDTCQGAIKKAASKFATTRLKSLEKCVDAVFTCVQTKPDPRDPSGSSPCLTLPKARESCRKDLAAIVDAEATFRNTLQSRCGGIPFAILGAPSGSNLVALLDECSDLGVSSLDSFAAYVECAFRQHECRVDELLLFETPRAAELLALLGDPAFTLPSCPAP
jgi:hypothetical protein